MRETLEQLVARANASAFFLPPDPTGGKTMAKLVKLKKGQEFHFPTKGTGGGGGESKYPWDEWFDGELRLLERSSGTENDKGTIEQVETKRDFEVGVNAMIPKLHTAARKRYKVVRVSRKDADGNRIEGGLIIQARDMDPDERDAEDLLRAEEKEKRGEKKKASRTATNGQQAAPTTGAPTPQAV